MPVNFGHLESTKIQIHGTKKELSGLGGEWIDEEPLHKPSEETMEAAIGKCQSCSLLTLQLMVAAGLHSTANLP